MVNLWSQVLKINPSKLKLLIDSGFVSLLRRPIERDTPSHILIGECYVETSLDLNWRASDALNSQSVFTAEYFGVEYRIEVIELTEELNTINKSPLNGDIRTRIELEVL